MMVSILIVGLVIDSVWLLAAYISEVHKNIYLLFGIVVSLLLCIYTNGYKIYLISLACGGIFGICGNGYKNHVLQNAKREMGQWHLCILFALYVVNVFMIIALACPG